MVDSINQGDKDFLALISKMNKPISPDLLRGYYAERPHRAPGA